MRSHGYVRVRSPDDDNSSRKGHAGMDTSNAAAHRNVRETARRFRSLWMLLTLRGVSEGHCQAHAASGQESQNVIRLGRVQGSTGIYANDAVIVEQIVDGETDLCAPQPRVPPYRVVCEEV